MQPANLAFAICSIPLISIHLCWIWSASVGAIDWCNPYWDGCVSISKAARSSDALFLFRGSMIFVAGLMCVFWLMLAMYLRQRRQPSRVIPFLGVTGALFLVLYADFLGTEGDVYRLMRRYGVIVYFTFTVLAQMLFYRRLIRPDNSLPEPPRLYLWSLWSILLIGLLSLYASATMENPAKDRWENALEWWFALLMTLNFSFIGWYWVRKDAFRLTGTPAA